MLFIFFIINTKSNNVNKMNNTELFKDYCATGKINEAKQLLKTDATINNSAILEMSFICACKNGHLEVAQWLYTIKPTIIISADNEYAFRYACSNSHLELAQWLQSLLPDKYKLVIENNKIIYYHIKRVLPFNTEAIQLKYTNKEELVCPICYSKEYFVNVQTNCKHNFCLTCITDYYNKCNGNCNCPYCRQTITSFYNLELVNVSN